MRVALRELRMSWRARQDGITLLELMVVVAIVGILAGIAIFMFTRHVQKARSSEVAAIFAEMKLREEAFKLENEEYLSTGEDDDDYFPTDTPPGENPQTYDLADSSEPPEPQDAKYPGPSWVTLKMKPEKSELYCVYVAIAGAANEIGIAGPKAQADFDFGGDIAVPAAAWYYLMAECDFDGDGTTSKYFTYSENSNTSKVNPGE